MTKIDYNYLCIPYKNKKTLFKGLLGHCKAKNMSPSDSTSKTEEKAASFISVECHFGSEKEKRICWPLFRTWLMEKLNQN